MTGSSVADLDIQVLGSDDRSIVYLRGELDASTATRLRASLADLIGAGPRHVVVDLRDLSFIGAPGLGVLVGAARRLGREGGSLTLRSARPGVERMIEITGLGAVLPQA